MQTRTKARCFHQEKYPRAEAFWRGCLTFRTSASYSHVEKSITLSPSASQCASWSELSKAVGVL
eukprot:3061388-Amphidinium_carterae.1